MKVTLEKLYETPTATITKPAIAIIPNIIEIDMNIFLAFVIWLNFSCKPILYPSFQSQFN